jgi:N-acetylmuramoyl-L-alanine amidase
LKLMLPPAGKLCHFSVILCAVRNSLVLLVRLLAAAIFVIGPASAQTTSQTKFQATLQAASQQDSQETPSANPAPQQSAPPTTPPQPAPAGPIVVIDPAHGGTDPGARGENGLAEKDIVLEIARTMRAELERQGFRVILTRNDDTNPSYDDRAGIANTYRDAIFISLHVSSTGTPGTARAYYYRFSTPLPPVAIVDAAKTTKTPAATAPPTTTLVNWNEAQHPYVETSHRLADLVQSQLAQTFNGSPPMSASVAVRTLRSVAEPAIAIEISSVSGSTRDSLAAAGSPVATAIGRSIATLRASAAVGAAGAK